MAKGSRGGRRTGSSGVNPGDIKGTRSLQSEPGKEALINEALQSFSDVFDEYGVNVNEIQLAKLDGKSNSAIAYYDAGDNIAINEKYFNDSIKKSYQDCVDTGFHPSNGNKTALQAVVAHELGHKLNEEVSKKLGNNAWVGLDSTATKIVNEARKQTKSRGVVQMASKISKYATYSNAEAIAEAFSDVYCNGKKAHSESRAIVNVLNKYLKGV